MPDAASASSPPASGSTSSPRPASPEAADPGTPFRRLVTHLPDLVALHAPDGTLLWTSAAAHRLLGHSPSDLRGQHLSAFAHEADDVVRFDARAVSRRGEAPVTFRLRHADGHVRRVETAAVLLRDAEGTVIGVQTATRDIGHRPTSDAAEDAGEEADARLQTALMLAPVIVFSHDPDLRYTWASGPFLSLDPDTLVGQTDADLLPEDQAETLQALKREVLETTVPTRETMTLATLDGPRRYALYLAPRLDTSGPDGGTATGLLGAARDLTDVYEADTLFEAGEDVAFRVLDSITDAFFALDDEWRFIYLNEQAEKLLRHPAHELMGLSLWEAFPDIVGSPFEQKFRVARRKGVTIQLTHYYRALDAWVEAKAFPFEGGLSVYFADVTARRQAEMALYEGQTLAASVLASIGDAFFALDDTMQITFANERARDLLRRAPHAPPEGSPLDDRRLWDVLPELEDHRFGRELRRARREGVDVTFTAYLDVLDRHAQVKVFPFDDGLSIYLADAPPQPAAANDSRRRALDAAAAGAFAVTLGEGRVAADPVVYRLFGLRPPDDPNGDGLPLASFARHVAPQALPAVRATLTAAAKGAGRFDLPVPTRRPDGTTVRLRGRVEHADDGTPVRLRGLCLPEG